jgi:3',5'-cyclic AMP phosphodiesterase CpdA
VEDTSVQLTWGRLGPGTLHVRIGELEKEVATTGGGGTLTIDGLEPGRPYDIVCAGPGVPDGSRALRTRTLDPPPGRELCRFATLSDLHVGTTFFDVRKRMREDHRAADEPPHPVRCTRAATRELLSWGAEHLVLKGDLVNRGLPEEWDQLGELFADLPIPHDAIPGNHDARNVRPDSLGPVVGARRAGLRMHTPVGTRMLPGLQLVLVDTLDPGRSRGRLPTERVEQVVEAVRGASTPTMVMLHHYLQALPVTWFWPPGIPRGQADHLVAALAATGQVGLVSSGHTHRHRRRQLDSIVATEVGSPKDFPGTWGGYVVHEGGIRQVVRRVESSDCIDWLERTARAALGLWGVWAPGRLGSRCFTVCWP